MSNFSVSFYDPTRAYSEYYDNLSSTILAAGEYWSRYVPGSGSIEIEVRFDPAIATVASAACTSAPSGSAGGVATYQQGVAAEMMTGVDPNGAAPDGVSTIGTGYLDGLWFDPDPMSRSAEVDPDKVDALSVFMHEIGHMIALNGWKDPATGAMPGPWQSSFDAQTAVVDGGLAFVGASAMEVYGGPVPLTGATSGHLGNPGDAAASDLMNGVAFYTGTRYEISALDVAMVADCGVPVRAATAGNDALYGFAGADALRGGKGDDALWGGAGDDLLVGGRGDDVLWGGAGNDVFEYEAGRWGRARDGEDTIRDFELGHDVLRLVGARPHRIEVSDEADGTHVGLSGGEIVIAGLHGYDSVAAADAWLKLG